MGVAPSFCGTGARRGSCRNTTRAAPVTRFTAAPVRQRFPGPPNRRVSTRAIRQNGRMSAGNVARSVQGMRKSPAVQPRTSMSLWIEY